MEMRTRERLIEVLLSVNAEALHYLTEDARG